MVMVHVSSESQSTNHTAGDASYVNLKKRTADADTVHDQVVNESL